MDTPFSSPLSPSQPLWGFALAFYAQPQVADACLQLQDEYQANVCLLIGLRWLDVREQRLDDGQLAALNEHIKTWTDTVILPLRSLRRALKLPVENFPQDEAQEQLRNAIKHAELLAEKKLLQEIEGWVNQHIKNIRGDDNLKRYLLQLESPDYLRNLLLHK